MTLDDINRWMAAYAREHDEAGISPEQAVALCRWKLSDKVDREEISEWMWNSHLNREFFEVNRKR